MGKQLELDFEEWRPIEGYEGLYEVSSYGRVRSVGNSTHKGIHIITSTPKKSGYLRLSLYKNNKRYTYAVHRLVAQAFIPNPNNYQQVNHKDENKQNNNVDNLEWCTQIYNQNYGTRNKRIGDKIRGKLNTKNSKPVLCVETGVVYPSIMEVNRQFGFSTYLISACCRKIPHKITAYGFHWEFAA